MALAKEKTSTTAITHNTRSPSTAITTTVVSQETIAFSGKLDDVYTELNNKFETLNIHVKKLETQVVQTNDVVQRQETMIKRKGEATEAPWNLPLLGLDIIPF